MPLPVQLTLKRSGLDPKNRPLEITSAQVSYDGKSVDCQRVNAVKYGSLRMEGAATGAWISDIHEFQLRSDDDQSLRITFSASFGKANKDAATKKFLAIEDGIHEAVTARIAARMNEAIAAGQEVMVGGVTLRGDGVHFTTGLLFKKPVFIPWDRVTWSVGDGELRISAVDNPSQKTSLKLLGVWNAVALAHALKLRTGELLSFPSSRRPPAV